MAKVHTHRSAALIIALAALGCRGPAPPSRAELRTLIESRISATVPLHCHWSPAIGISGTDPELERIGPDRGRYVPGHLRVEGEPFGCFAELEERDILASHDDLEFVLGDQSRFGSLGDTVTVEFPCATAHVSSIDAPARSREGLVAWANLELSSPRPEPLRESEDMSRLGCNSQIFSMPAPCSFFLAHESGRWVVSRVEGACADALR